jgi:hypothetical protein
MRVPDIHLKCPAGPHTRRCSRAMAHRRGFLRGKVTQAALVTLVLGLLLAGSVFISNQATGLRASMADLEYRREFLEASSGLLLTRWNADTNPKVIIRRAQKIGLEIQEDPGLVLVCRNDEDQGDSEGGWRKFLSRFGGGGSAQAAADPSGLVAGAMSSLTPRSAAAATPPRIRP